MTTTKTTFLALSALTLALTALGLDPLRSTAMVSSVFDWNALAEKPTKSGSTRKLFQAPTDMLAELECHVTTLLPGQDPHPPHQHPEEELYVFKEGTVEVLVNNERKLVGPGSVVFAAAGQPHGIRNAGPTPATYHVIKWTSAGAPLIH